MTPAIRGFTGRNAWASSFYQAPVCYKGLMWPDNEHPFQWSKTESAAWRQGIILATGPRIAKRIGRRVPLRKDWEEVKKPIMFDLNMAKFEQNRDLCAKLVATGDAELIEANTWGDTYWGMCRDPAALHEWVGHNYLGKILMAVRLILVVD